MKKWSLVSIIFSIVLVLAACGDASKEEGKTEKASGNGESAGKITVEHKYGEAVVEKGIKLDKIDGKIEFKNVWFSYDNKEWVLKNISFTIKKGETAAFVGETGAGKTTIISLITGFYDIQKGEILIDGINIKHISKKDLRKNISVVLQDVFLFSGDIKNNITLNDNIDDKTINMSLKASCAQEFINGLPEGVNHAVMERGSTFSAGERQLLAFARAIAHNPSIFILDEATANIDTHTELLIQKAIENITKNRTTIVIAHRLSTIRNADNIIVLSHGEIVEMGNHSELISKDGYYKRMLTESCIEDNEAQLA